MAYFNIVAQSSESTVVTEYTPQGKRSEGYQSEAQLEQEFTFVRQKKMGDGTTAVRFCTSWASTQENVDALCRDLEKITENS